MKKVLFVLQIVLLFCGIYACSEKEDDPQLDVKPDEVELDYNNSGSFSIVSNSVWAITIKGDEKDGAWLTVSQENGKGTTDILVRAKDNNTGLSVRSQALTITAENLVRTVTVKQKALPKVEVDSAIISFKAEGGENTFGIISNQKWTVQSNQEWCVVKQVSGEGSATIIVNADSHKSLDSREAEIMVEGGSFKNVVKVIQAGATPFIDVEEEKISFDSIAGSKELLVKSNISWKAKSCDTSWCNVKTNKDGMVETLIVSVEENKTIAERETTVILEGGQVADTINVVQSAGEGVLKLSKSEYNFTKAAGSTTFSITSNMKWTISTSETWCTVDKTSGEGNVSSVKISVLKNDLETVRHAIITVSGENGAKQQLAVTQAKGSILHVIPDTLAFDAGGGSFDINVSSDVSWTAKSNDTEWLTVSPMSGSGNRTLIVKAAENTTLDERKATITVTGDGIDRKVKVSQKTGSPFLIVSPSSLEFDSYADNKSISIRSNLPWIALIASSDQSSWCTLSTYSGTGNATPKVSVSSNSSDESRSAVITIKGGDFSQTVNVTQKRPTWLNLSTSSISVTETGAEHLYVNVTSNLNWTSSCNSSWCNVYPKDGENNGQLTITIDPNSTIYNREATIYVKGGDISREINVKQDENIKITTDKGRFSGFNNKGDSFYFNIYCNSNIEWYITVSNYLREDLLITPSSGFGSKQVSVYVRNHWYRSQDYYIYIFDKKYKKQRAIVILD